MHELEVLNKENLERMLNFKIDDELTFEKILRNEVLLELGLIYCIIYNYDSVITDMVEKVNIDINNIIEARFFNDNSEIRVFSDDGDLSGTIFVENGYSNFINSKALLYPRYGEAVRGENYASKLEFKKYIGHDNDNQAYISYIKPAKLQFEGGKQ